MSNNKVPSEVCSTLSSSSYSEINLNEYEISLPPTSIPFSHTISPSSCTISLSSSSHHCNVEVHKSPLLEAAKDFYSQQIAQMSWSPSLSNTNNECSFSPSSLPFLFPFPPPVLPCSYKAPVSKEDELISLILQLLHSLFRCGCLELEGMRTLQSLENIIYQHHLHPIGSRLGEVVRGAGYFFTPLPLAKAFEIYNNKYQITKRRYVPPTFQEVRHILNVAQILGTGNNIKLITFDGDETLYPDGQNFSNIQIANAICKLLKQNIYIAVVTAAGYGNQCERYEERLHALLVVLRKSDMQPKFRENFFVFGGESNYLFRCNRDGHLEYMEEELWSKYRSEGSQAYDNEKGKRNYSYLLDVAENAMKNLIRDLHLKKAQIIRKERAVGLVPALTEEEGDFIFKKENLDEAVHRINKAVADAGLRLAYCAFNGGHDVWVDAGNKAEGLTILQKFLNLKPNDCIHVGDQFQASGNDMPTRLCSPTLWVCNPLETQAILKSLFKQKEINKYFIEKAQRNIESEKLQKKNQNFSCALLDEKCFKGAQEEQAKLNEDLYCNVNVVDWRDT